MKIRGLCVLAISLLALCSGAGSQDAAYEWSLAAQFAPGVEYTRSRVAVPRPETVYCVRIDTRSPGLRFHTTGRHPEWTANAEETMRTTTRDFVRESRAAGMNMVVAINADAFEPWPAPWNQRTATNLQGLAISEGVVVSPASDAPSFVLYDDGRAAIEQSVADLAHVYLAVSGFAIVLEDGGVIDGNDSVHPRTGVGVSRESRYVLLLVIDGRRHASHGATTEEVGRWLLYFGADDGMNLDGGGSSTLARYDESAPGDGVVLLNNPVGDGVNWLQRDAAIEVEEYAPTERANGNNLGVVVAAE